MIYKPCLIIPTYRHHLKLSQIIQKAKSLTLPVIIVDDGNTAEVKNKIIEAIETENYGEIISHITNKGKGAAMKTGFKFAIEKSYTHALQIDADGQHNLEDLPKFLETSINHPNYLILGQPQYDASAPKARLIGRNITNFWVAIETLSLNIGDTMCGFRVYPLEAVNNLMQKRRLKERMDFDTEIIVRLYWQNVPIYHINTSVKYLADEPSNFRMLKDNILISSNHTSSVLQMLFKEWPNLLFRKKTTEETHWMKKKERGALGGMKFLTWVLGVFGKRTCILFMLPVIFYFYVTGKKAREAIKDYHQKLNNYALNNTSQEYQNKKYSVFKQFYEFSLAALDKAIVWQNKHKQIKVESIIDPEIAQNILDKKGFILLGSHLGNIEMLRAILPEKKTLIMNAIVFTEHAKKYNELIKQINPNAQARLIHVNEISIETSIVLKQKIENGEAFTILADRIPLSSKNRFIEFSFLGSPAKFPTGPFILSALMDCPIYTAFCLKNKNNEYVLYIKKLADKITMQRKDRDKSLEPYMQEYVKRLEHYCLRYPHQWYAFYDFWETQKNG